MNKIIEEFRRIKSERNNFVNETNKKGELLLSQAKNKFDSVNNNIIDKNINKKNLEKKNEYLDTVKIHLSKAINLNEELFSYQTLINHNFQEFILFFENKIKNILNKNNETINEEEDYENIQNIVKLANLTKILVEENIQTIKGESNSQKKNLLMQIKENINMIYNNISSDIISNNENKNKSIIDSISKIFNYISQNLNLIYNDISSINFNNEDGKNIFTSYILDLIFNNSFNKYDFNSNSKIWKLIITKNNNQEITISQSNFKNKSFHKIPKNYSVHIYIEKSSQSNLIIKLLKYIIGYVKNKIMRYYVITNNFQSKLEGYYCFEIFGIGKRKKKIIKKIINIMNKINSKTIYSRICIMIKISLYDELDILMKKKFFKLLKNEYNKINDSNNNITVNNLMNLVENDIYHNFNNNLIRKYLDFSNFFE